MDLDRMVNAYLLCALWASVTEDGTPLKENFEVDDISADSLKAAIEDCKDFILSCERERLDISGIDEKQLGIDFWLTRNRHGAGFWDRGLGGLGKRLTIWAHAAGSVDAVVGDDGRIHFD